jgi:hypothetical protein
MLMHKAKAEYNQAELNDLLNIIRTYINPNPPSCMGCGDGFRKVKMMLAEWVMAYRDKIETILQEKEKPQEEITPKNKKKK